MSKSHERQRLIRRYREETGMSEIDMHELARWAVAKGWPLPKPKQPLDILAREFSEAAREDGGFSLQIGHRFRRYHAIPVEGQKSLFKWMDIEEMPRHLMERSLKRRRDQMVGDGVQLMLDLDAWNRLHADNQPIAMPFDLREDIEERFKRKQWDHGVGVMGK